MNAYRRPGLSILDLITSLAILAILAGLLLPAVQKVREAAARTKSQNNLKMIGISIHAYHDTQGVFPAGSNDNGQSAAVAVLPFIEQDNLSRMIQANQEAAARKVRIATYESPRDLAPPATADGPMSYFFAAGTKMSLEDNDGLFYKNSKIRILDVTDGTSNTVWTVETLRGDGGTKAVDVKRQHVVRKAKDLEGLDIDAAFADFGKDKNIAGNRGASWYEGKFLQTIYTATLKLNDNKPDVDCGGNGGLFAPRSLDRTILLSMADGSVRSLQSDRVSIEVWQAMNTRAGGEVVNIP